MTAYQKFLRTPRAQAPTRRASGTSQPSPRGAPVTDGSLREPNQHSKLITMWTTFAVHVAVAMLPRVHITPGAVVARPAIRAAAFMTTGDDSDLSLDQIVAQVQSNVNEGELSTRGEGWFIAQAVLVLGVLFAPAEPVAPAAELAVGLAAIASGLALGAAGVRDLGWTNLTPWPKPVESNQLQIEGVYSLCRHPMYTCLLTASFGLSLVTLSFERLLLTVALFTLFSFKAGREEGFLGDKHGERYRAYAADVPQFFPTIPAIKRYVLGGD